MILYACTAVMLTLLTWTYLRLARAEKASRQTPVRQLTPNRRPDLFVPLEGHEGPREGFPKGTWVL